MIFICTSTSKTQINRSIGRLNGFRDSEVDGSFGIIFVTTLATLALDNAAKILLGNAKIKRFWFEIFV